MILNSSNSQKSIINGFAPVRRFIVSLNYDDKMLDEIF